MKLWNKLIEFEGKERKTWIWNWSVFQVSMRLIYVLFILICFYLGFREGKSYAIDWIFNRSGVEIIV